MPMYHKSNLALNGNKFLEQPKKRLVLKYATKLESESKCGRKEIKRFLFSKVGDFFHRK